jgi:hypothetical protein
MQRAKRKCLRARRRARDFFTHSRLCSQCQKVPYQILSRNQRLPAQKETGHLLARANRLVRFFLASAVCHRYRSPRECCRQWCTPSQNQKVSTAHLLDKSAVGSSALARSFVVHVHAVIRRMNKLCCTPYSGDTTNQIFQLPSSKRGALMRNEDLPQWFMPLGHERPAICHASLLRPLRDLEPNSHSLFLFRIARSRECPASHRPTR